jgi:eukaryotic-like serine/threonine-protein kinase
MSDELLLAQIAEDFIVKIRSGKEADPEEYALQYPQLAQRIREFFPTLMMLEGSARVRKPIDTPAPQAGLAPGSTFGSYRIQRELGRGGMGVVYEAVQVKAQKRVALKVLLLQPAVDARQLERFYREARITSLQVEEEWLKLTKVIYPEIRGKLVPADIFDEVQRLIAEYRAGKKR